MLLGSKAMRCDQMEWARFGEKEDRHVKIKQSTQSFSEPNIWLNNVFGYLKTEGELCSAKTE